MKHKIVSILLIGILFLLGTTSASISNKNIAELKVDEIESVTPLGFCEMMVFQLPYAYAERWIYTTAPSGDYKAWYTMDFSPLDPWERVSGSWHVRISAGGVTFFDISETFDYSGDNAPPDEADDANGYIPPVWNTYVEVYCYVGFWYYIDNVPMEHREAYYDALSNSQLEVPSKGISSYLWPPTLRCCGSGKVYGCWNGCPGTNERHLFT